MRVPLFLVIVIDHGEMQSIFVYWFNGNLIVCTICIEIYFVFVWLLILFIRSQFQCRFSAWHIAIYRKAFSFFKFLHIL